MYKESNGSSEDTAATADTTRDMTAFVDTATVSVATAEKSEAATNIEILYTGIILI